VKNCQGSSRVYTIKSQYTHHQSLANDVPTHPQKKKKDLGFGLWCVWKKNTHTHTQVVEKKSAFLHNIHLMGRSGQNELWYITL
jgi:hypothetical protein